MVSLWQAMQVDTIAPAVTAPPAQSPLDFLQHVLRGAALKCCDCDRWHNVPEKVMHEVRSPSSEGAMLYGGGVSSPLTVHLTD